MTHTTGDSAETTSTFNSPDLANIWEEIVGMDELIGGPFQRGIGLLGLALCANGAEKSGAKESARMAVSYISAMADALLEAQERVITKASIVRTDGPPAA